MAGNTTIAWCGRMVDSQRVWVKWFLGVDVVVAPTKRSVDRYCRLFFWMPFINFCIDLFDFAQLKALPDLSKLVKLKQLCVDRNQLSSLPLLPSTITTLECQFNRFSKLPPQVFALPKLVALDFSKNSLQELVGSDLVEVWDRPLCVD